MAVAAQKFGLSCAMTTPMTATGAVDLSRLTQHGRWVLDHGAETLTLFGTTGEGASLGLADRARMIEAMQASGVAGRQIHVGVASASLAEALEQGKMAAATGCSHLLLAPPFYFKAPSDEGLYAWFSRYIEGMGAKARPVILYHIPSVTAVGLSSSLIGRLKAAFPGVIAGIKDSSGNWETQAEYLKDHAADLAVLVGDERQLARSIALGGQGSICGLSNFQPGLLKSIIHEGADLPLVTKLVNLVCSYPVLPAVKVLVGHVHKDAGYGTMLPPLEPLSDAQRLALTTAYDALIANG